MSIVPNSTIKSFNKAVAALWPDGLDQPSLDLMSLVESEVAKYPNSTTLICLLADLVSLGGVSRSYGNDPIVIYQRALVIDPYCAEAFEGIAYRHYVGDRASEAVEYFDMARNIAERVDTLLGQISSFVELGQHAEANVALEDLKALFQRAMTNAQESLEGY